MKPFFCRTAAAFIAAAMASSCLMRDLGTADAVLSAPDIKVPADMEYGDVMSSLHVCSNVSWTAALAGDPAWIHSDALEHVNPGGVVDEFDIPLRFDRNPSSLPRTADMVFYGKGVTRQIRITQIGKTPRLRLESPDTVYVEAEPADKIRIGVLSNTIWDASILKGGTASVAIDTTHGENDGSLALKFSPNYKIGQRLEAELSVEAEGVEPRMVRFIQGGNEPFVRIIASATDTIVNPNVTTARVDLRVNSDWTAKVISSTIKDFKLDKTSGASGYISLKPTFAANDTDEQLTAEIEVSLNEYPGVRTVAKIAQRCGKVVELTFRKGSKDWSPALPSVVKTELFSGKYTFIPADYSVVFHVKEGGNAFCIYDNISLCFSNGATTTSWIEFPCIEGYKISTLTMHSTNTAGKQTFYIYDSIDPAGNLGTSMAKSAQMNPPAGVTTLSWGDTTPWTTAPEVGQTIYLYQKAQQNAKVDSITLIFTKE